MATKKDRIEIYRSRRNKEFGWRYITKNGKRVAVAGETYKNKTHASRMVYSMFGYLIECDHAEVVYTTKRRK